MSRLLLSVRRLATTTTLVAAFWKRTITSNNHKLRWYCCSSCCRLRMVLPPMSVVASSLISSVRSFVVLPRATSLNSLGSTPRIPTRRKLWSTSDNHSKGVHPPSRIHQCFSTSTSTSAPSCVTSSNTNTTVTTANDQMTEQPHGDLVVMSLFLTMRFVNETDSTQDEAKRFLVEQFRQRQQQQQQQQSISSSIIRETNVRPGTAPEQNASSYRAFGVVAKQQSNGRGTQGRTWEYGNQNLFLTVCLPMDCIPTRITLLPLQVAVIIAQIVDSYIQEWWNQASTTTTTSSSSSSTTTTRHPPRPKTTVKWPNDVLVNDQKISGTLIENCIVSTRACGEAVQGSDCGTDVDQSVVYLLIGIGVNIYEAPNLSESPGKQIRGATCLRDHYCAAVSSSSSFDNTTTDSRTMTPPSSPSVSLPTPQQLGVEIAQRLVDWALLQPKEVSKYDVEQQVLQDWKSFAEFGKLYELRGTIEEEQRGHYRGEVVMSVDIQDDGQLLIRGENGRERLLIADYMF